MAARHSTGGYLYIAVATVLAILSLGWMASTALGPCETSAASEAAPTDAMGEEAEASVKAMEDELLQRFGGALENMTARLQASERAVLRVQRLQKLQRHPNAAGNFFTWNSAAKGQSRAATSDEMDPSAAKPSKGQAPAVDDQEDAALVGVGHAEVLMNVVLNVGQKEDKEEAPIMVRVRKDWSPEGAKRFLELVQQGYFAGSRFHHVVPGVLARFGLSPDSRAYAYWQERPISDDALTPKAKGNMRGTIAFAQDGPHTRTCQMFVNLGDNPSLNDKGFVPFAEVVEGLDSFADGLFANYEDKVKQDLIRKMGQAYLDKWPKLSYIRDAKVVSSDFEA